MVGRRSGSIGCSRNGPPRWEAGAGLARRPPTRKAPTLALAPLEYLVALDQAEDEDLALRFQAGDEDALVELLRRHRGMAFSKARSWFLPGGDAEDVIQEATIGIFKAARDYSPEHNVVFGAFAELCVKRQIITAVKAAGRNKHKALNGYIPISAASDDEGDSLTLRCGDPDPADQVASHDAASRLKGSILGVLTALEAEVLHLYAQGRTYAEIGERVGRHSKAVDNAVQRIRRKLGAHLSLVTSDPVPA